MKEQDHLTQQERALLEIFRRLNEQDKFEATNVIATMAKRSGAR